MEQINETANEEHKETVTEYLRLRQHLTKPQYDRLVSSVAIAIQRALENKAPQEVVIRITDKGYVRFINPTDNHGPIE